MTPRWPDGSMVAEDSHEVARQLEVRLGIGVWFGEHSREFLALCDGVMIVRRTPQSLIDAVHRQRAGSAPAAPPPGVAGARGQGAPVPSHSGHSGRGALRGT